VRLLRPRPGIHRSLSEQDDKTAGSRVLAPCLPCMRHEAPIASQDWNSGLAAATFAMHSAAHMDVLASPNQGG